jgi:hypothetical protein
MGRGDAVGGAVIGGKELIGRIKRQAMRKCGLE